MSEQSLISLFDALPTKVTPTSGIAKTISNTIQTNHSGNGFHTHLINSMNDASTDDSKTALSSSSDINGTKNINQIIEMTSLGLSNGIGGNQIQLNHDVDPNITIETISNFITNNNTIGNSTPTQIETSILADNVLIKQESNVQGAKTLIEPWSNLSKILKETTIPLLDKPTSNLKENSALAILAGQTKDSYKVTGQKSTSSLIQTNTLLENVLISQDSKAQEPKALIEPSPNLLKVLNETTIPLSVKPNLNQSNPDGKSPLNNFTDTINSTSTVSDRTPTSIQIPANTLSDNIFLGNNGPRTTVEQDPHLLNNMKAPTTPFTDKSNTNQSNSTINEQDIFGVPNKSNQDKVAVEETSPLQRGSNTNAFNTLLKANNTPEQAQNTASSGNYSNTINNNSNYNPRLNIERESANSALQTPSTLNRNNSLSNDMIETKDNTTTNTVTKHNSLLNPEVSSNGKIGENLNEQQSDKFTATNTSTKSPSQQGLAKINSDYNESSVIFNTNLNSSDTNIAKSSDNTTFAHNNRVNIGDVASSANTSSDNSPYNTQGSDVLSEFNINSVNTRNNTATETSFNDTLSQINNSSKPLGTLGNDVADNIIQSAKLYIEGGKSEIKMQLNPQELGSLKLEFTVDDDILDAKITVERSAVKDIIEKDIPRLRELISGADIDVGKLDVSLQEKGNDRFGNNDKNFQPDTGSNSTQGPPDQGKEDFENEAEEEFISKNTGSDQINYLV